MSTSPRNAMHQELQRRALLVKLNHIYAEHGPATVGKLLLASPMEDVVASSRAWAQQSDTGLFSALLELGVSVRHEPHRRKYLVHDSRGTFEFTDDVLGTGAQFVFGELAETLGLPIPVTNVTRVPRSLGYKSVDDIPQARKDTAEKLGKGEYKGLVYELLGGKLDRVRKIELSDVRYVPQGPSPIRMRVSYVKKKKRGSYKRGKIDKQEVLSNCIGDSGKHTFCRFLERCVEEGLEESAKTLCFTSSDQKKSERLFKLLSRDGGGLRNKLEELQTVASAMNVKKLQVLAVVVRRLYYFEEIKRREGNFWAGDPRFF